jgi:hypothetical protein
MELDGIRRAGDWENELFLGSLGDLHSGVLRAWAMDYRRHVLYRLPGDQKFGVLCGMPI